MYRAMALLAVVLSMTACGRTAAPEPDFVSYPQEAWPYPPAVFERKTDQVEVRLDMDPAMQRYPELYARLVSDGVSQLQAFAAEQTAFRSEYGSTEMAPYSMGIGWAMGGETERLASFEGGDSQYGGGAHPDGRAFSILWDRTAKQEIESETLFRPDTEKVRAALLCRRLIVEKFRRDPSLRDVPVAELEQGCPTVISEVSFVLAPAVRGTKAAGLLYVLGPYVGGGYAEGVFRIFVPTAALRPLLAAEYADQFSENPRRPVATN